MSKPSTPKEFMPARWIIAGVMLAALGVAGAGGLRLHRRTTPAQHAAAASPQASALTAKNGARILASMESLPLAFEANQGQTDPQVNYMARGNGYTVFLTANETVLALHSSSQAASRQLTRNHGPAGTKQPAAESTDTDKDRTAAIRLHLVGANPHSPITAANELPGRSNYFIGNDRSQWHTDVPQYARISYRDAYPGVNMAYYGVQKQLEFDFIVAPGASPAPIRMGVTGATHIATDHVGNLILASSAGNVLLHKPVAYQQKDGARQPVDARFVLQANNQVSFELGNYDHRRELVIDPSVTYATYLGGTAEDDGNAIAVDGNGNAWVTGQTKSTDFPTTSALYGSNKGGFDVFVTKLSATTGSRLYSTYIGGSSDDSGNAIAVDASGNAFVAGGTKSSDFPTKGASQSTFGGVLDAFVLELSSTGSTLMYSTFLGGTGTDVATGLALDSGGNAYVVGSTTSTDFPTHNPLPSETAGGFITKLSASGATLTVIYSSYLGAGSNDFAATVAVDGSGNAYVTGATKSPSFFTTTGVVQPKCGTDQNCNGGLYDAFVSVVNSSGSGFVYSTFLGGESNDEASGIAVDSAGDAYVTGVTSSTKFPLGVSRLQATLKGTSDAFVSELNPAGTQLLYSTYLGGSGGDAGLAIAVDSKQNAYITGVTGSTDFPTASPTQSQNNGQNDAFVSEISTGGSSLVFSTYLGGSLNENTSTSSGGGSLAGIAVDSAGANIYVTGSTSSTDFPTASAEQTTAGGTGDAFVAKYSTGATTANFSITNGALSPASGAPGVSATATITVTSTNSFNSAVTLACSVAPVVAKAPTCSFSNPGASVTPPANSTATATLNLATTASSAMLERPSDRRSPGIFYAMLLPIGGITLLGTGLGAAGSRRKKLFGFLMLGLLLTALLFMPACSSSSGGGGGSTGTPTGTYTITVTGTSGSTVVTGSPALTFTVN
ncbi:MAG: SBBP repeat-containing protein [Candidatus Sulfotelmatobacter sp.]